MKLGFVYAGQGSQYVGMGQDFYEKYDLFKETIDKAGDRIKGLSFEGPEEELGQTKNTQPAMVAFAIGVTKLLHEAGIKSQYTLGLSLGEYSALYEAGVMDEEAALELVTKRGQLMTEAATGLSVKMSAVLGMDRTVVEECCKKASGALNGKVVAAANYNCPGQIVISGESEAVDMATVFLKEIGAKRIIPLKVSGPFHTSLMKPAGDGLEAAIEEAELHEMKSRVIFNTLGREKNDDEEIKELLIKQVQSPVYLEDSIRYMSEQGVDTVIEIGPGNAISKSIKKTAPEMQVYSIDKVEDFELVREELLA